MTILKLHLYYKTNNRLWSYRDHEDAPEFWYAMSKFKACLESMLIKISYF